MTAIVITLALASIVLAAVLVGLLIRDARRERAAQALRESEERFRLVADRVPAMIWTARPDTTLDYLNNTCAEFTGLPLDRLRDNGWLDIVHPEDRDGCVSVFTTATEQRIPFLHEYRLRRADGDYRWLMASGVPKHAPDGTFVGYIGCDFDITERKLAETLNETNHREIQQLAGRLLSAHEDERRHLARELHDDLTQRLARLAIDAGGLEQRAARDGEVVKAIREELVQLSDDVHALSYRLHPSVLDDLGLVEALKTECDRVARRGSFRIDMDANGVPAALPAEESLCLFRVAQEALSNVSRHASATTVTVALAPRDHGIELAVSDNGGGFDPEIARGRASLGLASMRERVRLLHGKLEIKSAPGQGTAVVAWLPEAAAAP